MDAILAAPRAGLEVFQAPLGKFRIVGPSLSANMTRDTGFLKCKYHSWAKSRESCPNPVSPERTTEAVANP